jgi:hypothetical protein
MLDLTTACDFRPVDGSSTMRDGANTIMARLRKFFLKDVLDVPEGTDIRA